MLCPTGVGRRKNLLHTDRGAGHRARSPCGVPSAWRLRQCVWGGVGWGCGDSYRSVWRQGWWLPGDGPATASRTRDCWQMGGRSSEGTTAGEAVAPCGTLVPSLWDGTESQRP